MIEIRWEGLDEFTGKMRKARQFVDVERLMHRECLRFIAHVKREHFNRQSKSARPTPNRLTPRSGTAGLLGSIRHEVRHRGKDVEGVVGVPKESTGAKYAAMHEREGETVIVPKRARMLRLVLWDGTVLFRRRVVVPGRPYFKPSMREFGPEMRRDLDEQVRVGLRRAGLL